MKREIFTVLAIAAFMVSVTAIGTAEAVTQITAQEAYDMVGAGEATLIDIRTLQEYYWVGTCALENNGMPIAYNIPYELWTFKIEPKEGYYKPSMRTVKWLFRLFITRLFPDRDTPLILMCRSGKRTDKAAEFLEGLGCPYTNIYEIDRSDKTGRGGFQGTSYGKGYRGYPGRDTSGEDYESVSWMDTGLPVTQKLDPSLIYLYMWRY